MYGKILAFLKALEVAVPPPSGHHSLTYAKYGSDDEGWEDRLALGMREPNGQGVRILFLEPSDFEKTEEALIAEIADLMSRPLE